MKSKLKMIAISSVAAIVIVVCTSLIVFIARSSTIEVASFYSGPEAESAFRNLIADFRKKNPGYDVKYTLYTQEELEGKIATLLAGAGTPDIVTWYSGYELGDLAVKKLIEPLDQYIPEDILTKNFSGGFLDASGEGDTLHMLPLTWTWWAVYYNKQVFRDAKLEAPDTWEDFISCCKTLKARKINPIAFAGKDGDILGAWFTLLDSILNGWEYHKELMSGNVQYTDKKVRAVLRTLADFTENGFFQPNAYSYDLRDASYLMLNGQAGMCLAPAPAMNALIPIGQSNSIGYFRLPDRKDTHTYAIIAHIEGFVMPVKAFNKKGGAKFLGYLAGTDAQDLMLRSLRKTPANLNAPVPDAEAMWALYSSIGASYAMQTYGKAVPAEMAVSGIEAFRNAMIAPKDLDGILADLENIRQVIYASGDPGEKK